MKFLVDAQLPPALARWLAEAGFEAQAVREIIPRVPQIAAHLRQGTRLVEMR